MKVLVVEDEFYARKAMIRQIKKYDQYGLFEISEASNGEEGWEFCEKYKPELVLTDIRMPKMDGIQLLQEIRNNELEIKVIILSAYSDFEYARSAIVNGASDYLLKPIDDTALTECLNKFVTQHKIERKEALLSRKDMATQYILNSIQESKYSGFIEIGRKLRKYHADEDSVCRIETGYVDIACKTGGRYAVFLETYQKTAGERGFPG